MCWKEPPSSLPVGTVALPPRMIAETSSLRKLAWVSIVASSRRIMMAAPCECPISTTGRPSLKLWR
jgi:hypothetical protein